MGNLEDLLGYKFKDKNLLEKALTHSSFDNDIFNNYERLEFLGDRVLGVVVAKILYERFPNEPEGSLSQRFMSLVCKECVAEVARTLEIPQYIKIVNEEIRNNDNILCDVCEAIIGAMFIDSGIEQAYKFVAKNWDSLIKRNINPPKDAKTALQELVHVKGLGAPVYREVSREGSEHEPVFVMAVEVKGIEPQHGKGKNKKTAEQEAAKKMLDALGN